MSEQINSDEISLKELIHSLLYYKKTILVITLVIFALAAGYSLYESRGAKSAEIIVSFNFDGIEIHKNPDGTDFNPYQIVSPHILSNVLTSLSLEDQISVNEVRSLIEISPIIPADIVAMGEYALEKTGESYTYYPNEYTMTLKVDSGKGIDANMAQRLENEIISAYGDYFNKTYLYQTPVANKLVGFEPDDYDYADVSRVYHSQIDTIKSYVRAHNAINPDFRSKRTGMSFEDIYYNIDLVDTLDMNKLDSMISAYKITKDRSRLIMYYEYMVKQLEYALSKYSAETDVRTNILSSLEDSSSSIANTLSGTPLDDSDSYFNSLILRTATLGNTSSSIQQEVSYYKRELDDLKSGNYTTSFSEGDIMPQVDALVASLDTEIMRWYDTTIATSDEFYDTYLSNTFYALSPSEIHSTAKMTLNLAIGLVLGLMIGVFVALSRAYWNDHLGGSQHEK